MGIFNLLGGKKKTESKKERSGKTVSKVGKENFRNNFTGPSSNNKVTCYECGGTGRVECDCTGGCGPRAANDDCPVCGGSGTHTCPVCRGRKWVYEN